MTKTSIRLWALRVTCFCRGPQVRSARQIQCERARGTEKVRCESLHNGSSRICNPVCKYERRAEYRTPSLTGAIWPKFAHFSHPPSVVDDTAGLDAADPTRPSDGGEKHRGHADARRGAPSFGCARRPRRRDRDRHRQRARAARARARRAIHRVNRARPGRAPGIARPRRARHARPLRALRLARRERGRGLLSLLETSRGAS